MHSSIDSFNALMISLMCEVISLLELPQDLMHILSQIPSRGCKIIHYDGHTQQILEDMVRNIVIVRNDIQRGRMAYGQYAYFGSSPADLCFVRNPEDDHPDWLGLPVAGTYCAKSNIPHLLLTLIWQHAT